MLADGGRFVLRYDHRDTGRSVTYEPGHPGYTGADLVADAVGVLDAYGIGAAHVVGVSAGGAFAQLLALRFPARVLSLVLISTSPAMPVDRELPPATERYQRFLASAEVDWSDEASVIEYLVGYARVLAGGERPFDEEAARELVRRDVERARDIAASENHGAIASGEAPRDPLSSIAVPTLVVHGTADPMFPPEHGLALVDAIPGASSWCSTAPATASFGPTGRRSSARFSGIQAADAGTSSGKRALEGAAVGRRPVRWQARARPEARAAGAGLRRPARASRRRESHRSLISMPRPKSARVSPAITARRLSTQSTRSLCVQPGNASTPKGSRSPARNWWASPASPWSSHLRSELTNPSTRSALSPNFRMRSSPVSGGAA